MYDIIGDVHGQYTLLKKLLTKMGYAKKNGAFFHPERKVIFVGDFINRGPEIRKTIETIRAITESGNGLAILGNHELNAIIFHLKDEAGLPLIKKPNKFFISLIKTEKEFSKYTAEYKSHLKWMRSLPLALDLGDIRVVHACWDHEAISNIESNSVNGKIRKRTFRKIQQNPDSKLSKDFWLLTRGLNFDIPSDLRIINNKGTWTRSYRLRWWEDPRGKTFEQMSFESKRRFPEYTIPNEILPETRPYGPNETIVFFGHYCRSNGPHIINRNLCCVDSCVNGSGVLTAYQWNGERKLKSKNLIAEKK